VDTGVPRCLVRVGGSLGVIPKLQENLVYSLAL
jgi:hypothetical protein